ncbi:MAG: deoxycytidine triphosphate deaminase [Candidatus Harrisonbacteria bacterium]|nr:deoxycytidine triphosphate deaminase [Candidatus Harrisonbacteria bacterium]
MNPAVLSKPAILAAKERGDIDITPFNEKNLANTSYDVTLGEYYYREQPPESGYTIYNPWQNSEVTRVWGKGYFQAVLFSEWKRKHGEHPQLEKGIANNNKIIWLAPGETILGHTNEFIGGKNGITTMMKARSSIGRNFITVCKCAGWGDIGYINRWTMEISNASRHYHIPLIVGRRIAQIIFFPCEAIGNEDYYGQGGKYQVGGDIKKLTNSWHPSMMLPRLYEDREIKS